MTESDNDGLADQTLPNLNPQRSRAPEQQALELRVEAAGWTDVGQKRTRNEDNFLIANLGRWIQIQATSVAVAENSPNLIPQGTVLMVADGMGGHGHGDVASSVTVDALTGHVVHLMPWFASPGPTRDQQLLQAFSESLKASQRRIEEVAARKGLSRSRMGTTATMCFIDGSTLLLAHVGDSRCYLLRAGKLSQVTKDHTLGQQLRDGGATEAVAKRFDHNLSNAVGGSSDVPEPELHRVPLHEGDQLMLCSDGLTGHVSDIEIETIMEQATSSEDACGLLVARANELGGTDNITAVVARLRSVS